MQNIFMVIYDWLLRMFWATEMNVSVIGLQNAGKTSLIRVLAGSDFASNSNPTVGFNVKRIQKGHVTIKWFVVDAADQPSVSTAAQELHALMSNSSLQKIPLLVLGNKSDLPNKLTVDELIDQFGLKSIRDREISCYGVSAKYETNLDAVVQWLVARSTTR
ncbi:hypothetical protein KEM54_006516 [Ascosphaera aggregata]|nr:hypothetical protein KEM54_006516 [Ascosphaera aggregata]